MSRKLLIVNTGASTLKLAMLDVDADSAREIQRIERRWTPNEDAQASVRAALDQLEGAPDAVGHRVVHGGPEFNEPVTLTPDVEHRLAALVSLAPLHNGLALAAIRAVRERYVHQPSVCVFDTAFHAHRPEVSMRYALPRELVERFGIRRYGFHGVAHASLVDGLASARGITSTEVVAVTLQLGAGCSACAVRAGRSLETSMGYTPLEGLVMTTRSGDVDPAIVVRLMRAGFDADRIEELLSSHSGLEALCGQIDMREILAAETRGDEDARFAIELFCHRIVMTVGAYFTLLGGEGALVFGGGIGTHSPEIRARIVKGLSAWGLELDATRNLDNAPGAISTEASRPIYALQTNEADVIARAVDAHLAAGV